jgi:predicted Zn-dependent protease
VRFSAERKLLIATFVVATAAALSCLDRRTRDTVRLESDKAAMTELDRLNSLLAQGRPVTRIDLDSLNQIRERYPDSPVVRKILQGALIKRGDWAAAEQMFLEMPDHERTNADRLNLAKIFFKQGKFVDAIELLKKVSPDQNERVEVVSLLGQSQLYSGALDEAANTLEAVRAGLVAQARADDLTTLGTIYFRKGEALRQAVAASPDNIAANNLLTRIYAVNGDAVNASLHQARVKAINERVAADEKKRSRFVPLYYQLEDAYAARDFEKVIAIVKRIQPEADYTTRQTLYQYLVVAYEAQGKQTEAQNARNEAAKLTAK